MFEGSTSIPTAEFQRRKIAVVVDDSAETGRAILVAPCQDIDAPRVNELVSLSGGILFAALSPERTSSLLLPPMSRPHTSVGRAHDPHEQLDLCVSVEAREGVTTGISAADRATTLRVLGDPQPNPRKLVKPGHIFPLQVREGGVLVRSALPEAALDVVRIAGFSDAAAFIDLIDAAGDFMSLAAATRLAGESGLPVFTLSALVQWRLAHETLVTRVAEARLPTRLAGEVRSCIYRSVIHSGEHFALVKGEIESDRPTLTRVQPEFTFTDVFGGSTPNSRALLDASLQAIGRHGSGVLIYLRRPARGQLRSQVARAHEPNDDGSVNMMREYGLGAQILRDLGVRRIELLANSQRDLSSVRAFGLEIVAQRPLQVEGS